MKRFFVTSFLTAVILAAALPLRADEQHPNVLFIAIDDLNDMVGFLRAHPGARTPNLNALAAGGVCFTNAHCAAPACAPSRTAVLTGLSPSTTGVYVNKDDWRENSITKDAVTIPDAFRAAGYATKGGGKIYHAHSLSPQAFTGFLDPEPWDEYFPSKQQQMPIEFEPDQWPVNSVKSFYKGRFDWTPLKISDDEMADGKVVTWAEKQLSAKHDKPLFLAVGIYRPHIPWWTPAKYFELHPLKQVMLPEVQRDDLDDLPTAAMKFPRVHWQRWIVENNQWEKAVQGYLASMTFADAMVGRLISALDDGPMASNTVIVLWSDHGYHLGHKQHWEKFALWEQATHVPLLFADTRPSRKTNTNWASGSRCDQPASLLDVYPTLAEICSLDAPENLEGESLLSLLRDANRQTNRAVVTTHGFNNHAVRSKRWRYIRYADGSEELYDHRDDPNEYTNLASSQKHSAIRSRLSNSLPKNNRPSSKN